MREEDDQIDQEERDLDRVSKSVKLRLKPVEEIYKHALTSLWLSNGSGALATMSFMSSTAKNGKLSHQFVWPLLLFVFGMICMALSTLAFLWKERQLIRAMEDARSLLDIKVRKVERPSERAGLTVNTRNMLAFLSGLLFVAGCVMGLFEILSCD